MEKTYLKNDIISGLKNCNICFAVGSSIRLNGEGIKRRVFREFTVHADEDGILTPESVIVVLANTVPDYNA